MNETLLKPALTEKEWEEVGRAGSGDYNAAPMIYQSYKSLAESRLPQFSDRLHALAAFCLQDQEFGFTRRTLRVLVRGVPEEPGYHEIEWTQEEIDEAEAELDKVRALLPPEPAS